MKDQIDPYEIKTIESITPITITMEDGSTFTATRFKFINQEASHSIDGDYDGFSAEVQEDDSKV